MLPQALSGTTWINGISFVDADLGFVSAGGKIHRTTDGGNTWQMLSLSETTTDVDAVTDDRIASCGIRGSISVSSNGGDSWFPAQTGAADSWQFGVFMNLAVADESHIWASGFDDDIRFLQTGSSISNGVVTRSTDGGSSWDDPVRLLPISLGTIGDISFASAADGWIVGAGGTIIKYTGVETPTSVERIYPDAHSIITMRSYPNPVQSAAVIRLSVPQRTHVRIRLDDLHGRTVYILNDGELAAGTHQLPLVAPDVPGTYFLHLNYDGRDVVEKIVVIP
jgi:hypothetical protein